MKKIEAKTLEKAYEKAAGEFGCSVLELECEIIQHPTKGFLGFGAKDAVIVAVCKRDDQDKRQKSSSDKPQETNQETETDSVKYEQDLVKKRDLRQKKPEEKKHESRSDSSEAAILNGFFDESTGSDVQEQKATKNDSGKSDPVVDQDLNREIEERLGALIESTCFDMDTVEVDVIDGTAYIFLDGEDAALLIGKEGYRYNALSYLLYNWIHNEYGLFIKLEIAQFLASQQEMIRNYIQPVVDHVYKEGWGKTRPLDGILVQIALEQLREEFPNKYVAIKRTRNGERYILINEFNKRS